MRLYLKTKTVKIKALGGEALKLTAISAAGQAAIMDEVAKGEDNFRPALLACKYCVKDWSKESLESIAESVSYDAIIEISNAAAELSGVDYDPKDSRTDQVAA